MADKTINFILKNRFSDRQNRNFFGAEFFIYDSKVESHLQMEK